MHLNHKPIFLAWCLSMLAILGLHAQTVTIPDTSFARCLKTSYPSIFTADGRMNTTAAATITGTLTCHTGNVQNAEGLQYFKNISVVHLDHNELERLPNIGALTKLQFLDVIYNELDSIPGLDKLVALETLNCWKNELTYLPNLSKLTNLVECGAHNNRLTQLPEMGSKPKLTHLYLNENKIEKLSDLSGCPKLVNVRLYRNRITFKELVKLTTKKGYDTIVKLNPQDTFLLGASVRIKEADTLLLSTGIDQGVAGVYYDWYKQGKFIATVTNDSLVVAKASFADRGAYRCVLRHDSFPSVKLVTNVFTVSVDTCLTLKQTSITTSDINCLNEGSVFVTTGAEKVNSFELLSMTGKKHVSSNGNFEKLSETSYTLSLTTSTGCTKAYQKTVTLGQKECEEVLLSPDNDGQGDSYFFKEHGKVTIYDKRGQVVKSLTIPGEWDGSSDKGKVFNGFYVADINNGAKLLGITVLY